MTRFQICLAKLKRYPIYKLLQFEEALLRTETNASQLWIIVNEGTPAPRIVMGSSGKPEELLHMENVRQDGLPVIRRFTGGGTVLVDHNTMFASFVGSHEFLNMNPMKDHHDADKVYRQPYPTDIMHWTSEFYRPVFNKELEFDLLENDYIFKNAPSDNGFNLAKFGGNAQYLTGGKYKRFCHHTSFLWDHDPDNMHKYLTLPSKRPKYRESREHGSFLTNLTRANWSPQVDVVTKASDTSNKFLLSVMQRVYQLCNTDWSMHVEDLKTIDQNHFEEIREEYLARENNLKRNTYYYHPDESKQGIVHRNDLD